MVIAAALLLSIFASAETPDRAVQEIESKFFAFKALSHEKYKETATITFPSPVGMVYSLAVPSEARKDGVLGRANPLSTRVRHAARTDREILFDVTYDYDKYGRRVTEVAQPQRRKKFAIFSGCSFTQGHGVAGDQTIPAYLGMELRDYQPYNYGIKDTGTNSMLGLVETIRFREQIPQKSGVMIYVSLGDEHVNRSTGKLPSLQWLAKTPYYEMRGNELVRNGTFLSARPIYTETLLTLGKLLPFFRISNEVLPPLGSADYKLVCAMVKKAQEEFYRQYPGSRFLYYLHPLAVQSLALDTCLERAGVESHRGKIFQSLGRKIFPGDGHPVAEVNRLVALQLAEILKMDPSN